MKRKYQIRHEILSYLYNKIQYNDIDAPQLSSTVSTLDEIAKGIGCEYDEFFRQHHAVNHGEHAKCITYHGEHCMMLCKEGISAVLDEYWLREGIKERNERIYDKTKWVVPVISAVIAIISASAAIYTILVTQDKLSLMQREHKALEIRISEIEASGVAKP